MASPDRNLPESAVFITFSGNCEKALSFYHSCFGGSLQIETFDRKLDGFPDMPVLRGSLFSERVIIHGSDLVHNEGRKIGNYMAIFLQCRNNSDRNELVEKLKSRKSFTDPFDCADQKLIEFTDDFEVRWILAI